MQLRKSALEAPVVAFKGQNFQEVALPHVLEKIIHTERVGGGFDVKDDYGVEPGGDGVKASRNPGSVVHTIGRIKVHRFSAKTRAVNIGAPQLKVVGMRRSYCAI